MVIRRQDYQAIGRAINFARDSLRVEREYPGRLHGADNDVLDAAVSAVAKAIATHLARDNYYFDRDKFLDHCGVSPRPTRCSRLDVPLPTLNDAAIREIRPEEIVVGDALSWRRHGSVTVGYVSRVTNQTVKVVPAINLDKLRGDDGSDAIVPAARIAKAAFERCEVHLDDPAGWPLAARSALAAAGRTQRGSELTQQPASGQPRPINSPPPPPPAQTPHGRLGRGR